MRVFTVSQGFEILIINTRYNYIWGSWYSCTMSAMSSHNSVVGELQLLRATCRQVNMACCQPMSSTKTASSVDSVTRNVI